jgi:hypothetical protein
VSRLAILFVAIPMFIGASVAHGGTVYTMRETVGSDPGEVRLIVEGESLRLDQSGDDAVIFDAVEDRALTIDHSKKSYIVIDHEAVTQAVEQLSPALGKIRKQLENLPPDKRAKVEKLIGSDWSTQKPVPPRWDVTANGETATQAGIDCQWHDVRLDGKLTQRLCMADPDKVTGGRAALANMRAMAQFFDEVFTEVREQLPVAVPENPISNIDKVDGFPIITQELSEGVLRSDLRLESAQTATVDGGAFEPPAGYSQRGLGRR